MHVICAPLLTTMELFERICCPLHLYITKPGGFTLKATLTYQETKTLNSDKIALIADDNNKFSDLSRSMMAQARF